MQLRLVLVHLPAIVYMVGIAYVHTEILVKRAFTQYQQYLVFCGDVDFFFNFLTLLVSLSKIAF